MEVTLYVALVVNPGPVKIHLGALEIILAFHEAPKSHSGAEVERGDVVLHTRT